MAQRRPRYHPEEFARRGEEMYDRRVRSLVEGEHQGRIVAVDIDSGEFEVADDVLSASDRLRSRYPDAQPWIVRVGSPTVYRIGRGTRADSA